MFLAGGGGAAVFTEDEWAVKFAAELGQTDAQHAPGLGLKMARVPLDPDKRLHEALAQGMERQDRSMQALVPISAPLPQGDPILQRCDP